MRVVLPVFIVLLIVGCQSAPNSPFDVYQSPLLAKKFSVKRANNSSFDPTNFGDFPTEKSDEVIASSKTSSPWRKQPTTSRPLPKTGLAQQAKKLPSLSTTRVTPSRLGPRNDVSMVLGILAANDIKVGSKANTAVGLYKMCKAKKAMHFRPNAVPGAIVFFHNTADMNTDGRNNDWYSHVGVVTGVDEHQTAIVTSFRGNRMVETRLNLLNPDVSSHDGVELNGRVRDPAANDPPYTQYHAGELFAGFCNVMGNRQDFKMFESWKP